MGLFGALFAGVSGLSSQSNKIGIISNNISNVNTVGFKQDQAAFDTLVVPSGTTTFSPGGVIGANEQLVNQQGLISATSSPTDIAITGGGMLFVSSDPAGGANSLLFTRAGSFTQDASGNFKNADGYYLQGLTIDPKTGNAVSANTQNLATVNVSSSATGKPTPTSLVTLGANFDASQPPLLGPGRVVGPLTGNDNVGISANQIIVGNNFDSQDTVNSIVRGDTMVVTNGLIGGTTSTDTLTYGGFSVGRNINVASNDAATTTNGDGANILNTETVAGANIVNNGSGGANGTITMTVVNANDYITPASGGTGTGFVSVSGAQAVNGISAADINGEHAVTKLDATHIQFTASNGAVGGGGSGSSATAANVSNRTFDFAGNILDAKSATDDFLGTTTTSPFASDALSFSVQVANVGSTKFTYSSNPDPSAGTFNSLNTLATAINDAQGSGLTAQVTNGRIYISATDANNAVVFLNGDAGGNTAGSGINWVQELDVPNSAITNVNAGSNTPGLNYFNTLSGLAQAVNSADPNNLVATVNNPTGQATVSINEANAQQTIAFADGSLNTGTLLKEFNFQSQGGGLNATPPFTTGTIPITYDPTSAKTDMSSGAVTPQFSKDITIFDSLGISHTIAINVAKLDTATSTWAVELTAVPPTDVVSDNGGGSNGDGQITAGTVTFNGNGVLTQASASLQNFTVNWNTQKFDTNPSPITLDLGLGSTSTTGTGLTQAAGAFNVSTDTQNGAPTGELTGVSIDQNGFVIASFSNGQTQKMFQVPLANFTNPNGLLAVSGDAYQATLASGPVNPELAGTSGVGTFTPSALEQSNVDLSTQLTNLIVAQQAYGANSKVLTVADQLLQQLDQIIQ
jgi:flagellar hook protein FlgE